MLEKSTNICRTSIGPQRVSFACSKSFWAVRAWRSPMMRVLSTSFLPGPVVSRFRFGDITAVALSERGHELRLARVARAEALLHRIGRVALVVARDQLVVIVHRRGVDGEPVQHAEGAVVADELEQGHR